jgi:hypothetical protein
MALLTFACPACQKVLKSFSPIAAGTRVKCPTCGASFTMSARDASPVATPSTAGAAPVPKVAGRRKGRALLVGAAVLLLAALAAGAYFLFSRGGVLGSRPEEDPLAYLPPGTEFVAGADVPTLLDDPTIGPAVTAAIREQAGAGDFLDRCEKQTGLSTRDLLGHTLLAGKLDVLDGLGAALVPGAAAPSRPAPVTLILKPSRPFDARQVARAAEGARPRTAHGKTYYEVSVGEMRTLYMPSDRVIVLSMLPAGELDAVFASDGTKPSLSADAVSLVRSAESHPFWAVVPFEGTARARLESAARNDPQSLADALLKAKGVAVWEEGDRERLRVGADVPCADARAADRVATEAKEDWEFKKMELLAFQVIFLRSKTGKALQELTNGVKFSADGATARAGTGVSREALTAASEEIQKAQQGGRILGGFPPPIIPKLPVVPGRPK